ncbi:MAG: tetratricopeptide repeat protein [Anaerolineales bacterium]
MRSLRLLGPASVETTTTKHHKKKKSGDIPRFRSRRTIALLGYLVAEKRPIAREFLAALFWPDENTSDGRTCLRRELYNLTRVLPDCWELDWRTVTFIPSDTTTVDLYTLQELEKEERWAEMIELLGGDFLEGIHLDHNPEFELWILGEREHWRGKAEEILTKAITTHIRRGRYQEALRHARILLKLAPWNEQAHRKAMRLLAWTGQRGAALRQFEECKRVLMEELNHEPADETIGLYHKIHKGELDLPPQLPAFLITDEKPRRTFDRSPFVGREGELERLHNHLTHSLKGQGKVVFITGGPGRGKTALLQTFTQVGLDAHPNLIVAQGKCHAYSGVGDPLLPFRELLGMLTGDVEAMWDAGAITREHAQRLWAVMPIVIQAMLDRGPQLLDALAQGEEICSRAEVIGGGDDPWLPRLREQVTRQQDRSSELVQSQLFQQVINVLFSIAKRQPLLLMLDDVQWADPASMSLLFHLGRSLIDRDHKILIVCAYRPEEVVIDHSSEGIDAMVRHPLAKVLSEFKRIYGDVWIDLGQPGVEEGRLFVDAFLDTEPNRLGEGFRSALFSRTEGHPLFTIELLRTMQDRGDLVKDDQGRWVEGAGLNWSLFPARVESVIEERISRLDPELQYLLNIASVEGEEFTAQVLAHVQGQPESSVLRTLSQDLEQQHRLVKVQKEILTRTGCISSYNFGHVLYKDYLYNRLTKGEQRILHGEVAQALEEVYEGRIEEMAGQLARHYHQAGDRASACRYYAMAAERDAKLYAGEEVILHYSQAIDLAEDISLEIGFLARLYRGRGRVFERMGEFNQALTDHTISLQLAREVKNQKEEWQALLDLGRLWASRDYQRTREYFLNALTLARTIDDPAILANSLNWMGNWQTNAENPLKAIEYHQQALEIAEKLEDWQELANTLDLLGVAKLMEGDLSACVDYYDRAIALQRKQADRLRLVSSLTGRAVAVSAMSLKVCVPVLPPPDGIGDSQEAIDIADEIGDLPGKAWALYAQGMVHLGRGRFGLAEKTLKEGLQLSLEIKHQEYVVANRFGLGILYQEVFAPEQALKYLKSALPMSEKLRSPAMIHNSMGPFVGALLMMNDLEGAQTCLEKVLSAETAMDTLGKRACWVQQVELALAQGEPAQALDIVDRLIVSVLSKPTEQVITYLWKLKGEALLALNRAEEALHWLQAAIQNAKETKERLIHWRVHDCLGRVYIALGLKSEAKGAFLIAKELVDKLAETILDEKVRKNYLQCALDKIRSSS